MSVKPITPAEAEKLKTDSIPDIVIECFNELIAKNMSLDGESTVLQKDVVSLIVGKSNYSSSDLYRNKYLDVEKYYRSAGWHVVYDKPAYCENYDAFFVFSSKRKS